MNRKRTRNVRSSLARPRLHGLCDRLTRRELGFANCSLLDAVLGAAASVEWMAGESGAIVVADDTGKFITKVWNPATFRRYADQQSTGVEHGPYVLQPDVPAGARMESLRLIVEVPEY